MVNKEVLGDYQKNGLKVSDLKIVMVGLTVSRTEQYTAYRSLTLDLS